MSSIAPPEPVTVFISYAHEDEKLRERLESHLALLRRQKVIASWHDREISPGEEWADRIDANINSAKIILLLVSPDFFASDYSIEVEMKCAMRRHKAGAARVIPVILRPCAWQSAPFGKLQALPRDGKPVTTWSNRDEAFLSIAEGIGEAVRQVRGMKRGPAARRRCTPAKQPRAVTKSRRKSVNGSRSAPAEMTRAAQPLPSALPAVSEPAPVTSQVFNMEQVMREALGTDESNATRTARATFRLIALDLVTNPFYLTGEAGTTGDIRLPEWLGLFYQGRRDFLMMTSYVVTEGARQLRPPAMGNDPSSDQEFVPESWVFIEQAGAMRQLLPTRVPGERYYDLTLYSPGSRLFLVTVFRGSMTFRDGKEQIWLAVRNLCGVAERLRLGYGGYVRYVEFESAYTFPHQLPVLFHELPPARVHALADAKLNSVERFRALMEGVRAGTVRNTIRDQANWKAAAGLWKEVLASAAEDWVGLELQEVSGDVLILATGELVSGPAALKRR